MTQNVAYIPSGGPDFFGIPVSHSTTLDQNTRDSLRSRIIIGTTGSHVGFYHIWHVHLLRHLTRNLHHILRRSSRIIHIRSQLLIIISTVQINIKIRHRLQLLRNRPCQTLHLCTIRISRKFTVQILPICQSHTSVTCFKSRPVHNLHNDDRSDNLLYFQLLRQFDRCLDTNILSGMHTCSDQHRLTRSMSVKYCCRKTQFTISQFQLAIPLFTRLNRDVFQMKSFSFAST